MYDRAPHLELCEFDYEREYKVIYSRFLEANNSFFYVAKSDDLCLLGVVSGVEFTEVAEDVEHDGRLFNPLLYAKNQLDFLQGRGNFTLSMEALNTLGKTEIKGMITDAILLSRCAEKYIMELSHNVTCLFDLMRGEKVNKLRVVK